MTFLSGELLAYLGALGLPVLVHLLNLRRRRTRDIPTLRFLQEIERTRLRRVRLTRWLLLLVRVLLLLALVLAFARPLLRGGAALLPGGREARALVLLLDDSASSRLPGDGGLTAFEQARELAAARLARLEPRDRVWIVPLARPAEAAGPLTPEGARARLAALRPGWGAARLEEAVARTLELLADAPAVGRQLLLLSDLRLPLPEDLSLPADLSRQLVLLPSVSEQAAPESLRPLAGLLREDRPALLEAVAAGAGSAEGLALLLDVEGETRARRVLSGGGASWRQAAELELGVAERGWLRGRLRLDGDAVAMDNELPFVLHVPAVRRVGLLCGDAEEEAVLAAALQPDARYRRGLELVRLDAEGPARLDPASLDQLVLAVGRPLPAAWQRSLRELAGAGVRLLLLPDPAADAAEAGRQLAELGLPAVAGLAGGGPWRLERLDRGHEVLASILEPGRAEEAVELRRVLELAPADPPGVRRRSLAEAGGRPLIVAFERPSGRALWLGSAVTAEWSGLAASGLLAPLVQQGLRWLDGDERLPAPVVCGEPAHLAPPRGRAGTDWQLRREEARWRVSLDPLKGWLDLPPLPEPGHYELLLDGANAGWVAARLPEGETTAAVADPAAWARPDAGGWSRLSLAEAERGVEAADLGPALLVLALLLLAAEGWLASGRGRG